MEYQYNIQHFVFLQVQQTLSHFDVHLLSTGNGSAGQNMLSFGCDMQCVFEDVYIKKQNHIPDCDLMLVLSVMN